MKKSSGINLFRVIFNSRTIILGPQVNVYFPPPPPPRRLTGVRTLFIYQLQRTSIECCVEYILMYTRNPRSCAPRFPPPRILKYYYFIGNAFWSCPSGCVCVCVCFFPISFLALLHTCSAYTFRRCLPSRIPPRTSRADKVDGSGARVRHRDDSVHARNALPNGLGNYTGARAE